MRSKLFLSGLLVALSAVAAAHAQEVVQALPGTTDADLLAADMRRLAANPRDVDALVDAAQLSLRLDDRRAAAALLARAENVEPRNARVKAGQGSILVQSERPGQALRYFAQAESLGLDPRTFAADRALAYDLVGDQERAQRAYRAVLRERPADEETIRRYALSLGISGQRARALVLLEPLVRRSDRGAWRSQAFVLAMTGDVAGASRIAATMMPGSAAGLSAFFLRLPSMSATDRAFAVHFGEVRATPERLADARLTPPLSPLPREGDAAPVLASNASPARPVPRTIPVREAPRTQSATQPNTRVVSAPVTDSPPPTTGNADRAASPPVTLAANGSAARTGVPMGLRPQSVSVASAPLRPAAPTGVPPERARTTRPPVSSVSFGSAAGPAIGSTRTAAVPARVVVNPAATVGAAKPATAAASASDRAEPRLVGSAPDPLRTAAWSRFPIVAVAPTRQATPFAATPFAIPPLATPPRTLATTRAGEDTILARIVAGLSIPASELGVGESMRAAPAVPVTQTPRPVRPDPAVAAKVDADRLAAAKLTTARAAAVVKRATDRKAVADKKALADKRAASEKEALAVRQAAEGRKLARANSARIWVQVAGGAYERDLVKAWSNVKGRAPGVFGNRQGWTTPLRATNRVLAGPFKTDAEARGFVNDLKKQGVSGFTFTSEAGQPVKPLTQRDSASR